MISGSSRDERHAILELVAKSISPAGLVEGRTRPDPTRERLIEQPAVKHDVHRSVGGRDLDSSQCLVPRSADFRKTCIEIDGAIALDKHAGLFPRLGLAEEENDLRDAAGRKFERGSHRGAGI